MKVAVILGGTSYERDVSLKTGKAVIEACRINNYDVETVIIDENYKKFLPILKKVDIVFNALHGTLGEDGTIQKWLEENEEFIAGNNIYVEGCEVPDFHLLRKESIFTLATAALQEVDRQLQAEKVKVATLQGTVASQQAIINDLLTRVSALENA